MPANFLRGLCGHLFDVNAPSRADHKYRPLRAPIHDYAHVRFCRDLRCGCHQDFLHRQALDCQREDPIRDIACFLGRVRQLYPARLSSATGVHLRFHHYSSTELARDPLRFVWRRRNLARWDGNSGRAEYFLCLVLVDVHSFSAPRDARRVVVPGFDRWNLTGNGSSRASAHSVHSLLQLGYYGATTGRADVIGGGLYLRRHAALTEGAATVERACLVHRQPREFSLRWLSPIGVDAVDIGENEKQIGAQLTRENTGRCILVYYRVQALDPFHAIDIDRYTAPAGG